MANNNSIRSPTKTWTMYHVLLMPKEAIDLFFSDYHNRFGSEPQIVHAVMKDPSALFLCYIYLNHSLFAQKKASSSVLNDLYGIASNYLFDGHGCSRHDNSSNTRFWRVLHIDVCSGNTLEEFSQLEKTVSSHSDGSLHSREFMGKLCCRSCLYLVMVGKMVDCPAISVSNLTFVVDRFLVRFILLAADSSTNASMLSNNFLYWLRRRRNHGAIVASCRPDRPTYAAVQLENDCQRQFRLDVGGLISGRRSEIGYKSSLETPLREIFASTRG